MLQGLAQSVDLLEIPWRVGADIGQQLHELFDVFGSFIFAVRQQVVVCRVYKGESSFYII